MDESRIPASAISRRALLKGGAAAALGAGVFGAGIATGRSTSGTDSGPGTSGAAGPYSLFGEHPVGVTTPAQDRLHFAALDVTTRSRAELRSLLDVWGRAAERMMRGEGAGDVGPTSGPYDAPPDDTGEAIGLPPAGLTITFGFGPSLFDGRFGLANRRPAALRTLPHFPGDTLDPARSDGDLCIQACSDDPQVAVHAVRNLVRLGFGTTAVRWSQLGFGRTSSTTSAQVTPRNLFGFKDGTANIKAEEADALDRHVWVRAGQYPEARWLVGGTFMVARRISMTIETWDQQSLRDQENIIGRTMSEGAPMSGGGEFDEPDFRRRGREGRPLIDAASHVALAHPTRNDGVRMLRRGYNFVDGSTDLGRLDAGLFFIAFVNDPRSHFIPMQNAMAKNDLLVEYLRHTGSGLFAVPPGLRADASLADTLFDR